ncbi:MAG: DUF3108 domain-containing protein [Bacteroidetes bacterium]|nr:DUF3108 domain-containing protein [Bacteroidota bacterium]MCZ2131655.1 DUF3108 domain-containing protein [Bacteroidota bacterium]
MNNRLSIRRNARLLRLVVLCLSLLLVTSFRPDNGAEKSSVPGIRFVNNEAFGLGERLDYSIGYKFITAGTASFTVMPQAVIRNDKKCFDARFEARSLKSLDWLYRVHDQYRTVMDIDGVFPHEFEQHIREGGYRRDFTAKFDQVNNFAITSDKKHPIPPFCHDIVSAFYYVRTLDLKAKKKGDIIQLHNFFGDTTYSLGIKILGRQTVEVEAGKFRCVVIEPMVVEGGLFKSDGRILIWLSDDERKIPVKVSTKVVIGSIDAELTGYQGLRGALASKILDE